MRVITVQAVCNLRKLLAIRSRQIFAEENLSIFDFYKGDKLETSATIWSEFYFVNMPKVVTQEFTGLEPNTDYRVNITAIDSWGKESAVPLKVEFTTEGE